MNVAEEFRANLNDYVRKYGFLAQIVPYRDAELERLHLYGRYLLNLADDPPGRGRGRVVPPVRVGGSRRDAVLARRLDPPT